MAAGLGFKTFTTGEVLTAADTNGYLMQGILVFASAAARDAAITSPQEGQFAYLKDTNVTTYYTGSAWANVDTTGMTNPMTTTGDTIYSSSGSTPARLGIGSTGQVLTVAGGIPSWATPAAGGGMTLINSGGTALSGTSTSITSIPSTYKHLYCVVINASISGGTTYYSLRLNNDSTTGNYQFGFTGQYDGTANLGEDPNANHFYGLTWSDQSADSSCYEVSLPRYTDTVANQFVTSQGFTEVTSTQLFSNNMQGIYKKSAAITSIQFQTQHGSSTFATGTVYVYGVS